VHGDVSAAPARDAANPTPYPATARQRLRWEWDRARSFARRLERVEPSPPVPPPLPEGRTVVVPGIGEVFVRATDPVGGRMPVLLLHGWMAGADLNWFRTYPALAPHRQVVALDHQGHGRGVRSDQPFSLERCADAGAGVLEALGVQRAIVVGYSMGGPIALQLWHRHRARVAGLVLGATALEWRARPVERIQWEILRIAQVLMRFTTGRVISQRLVRQAVDDDPSLAPWRAWLSGETKRGYLPDLVEAGRELSRYDARRFAPFVDVPTAVLLTQHDRLVRPRKQKALATTIGATVFTVDGDHDSPLVRSTGVNDALLAALDVLERRLGVEPTARPATTAGAHFALDGRVGNGGVVADEAAPMRAGWG
jgi:3-oxoadipate enol-lactonase